MAVIRNRGLLLDCPADFDGVIEQSVNLARRMACWVGAQRRRGVELVAAVAVH
jgi:hypothetical protein